MCVYNIITFAIITSSEYKRQIHILISYHRLSKKKPINDTCFIWEQKLFLWVGNSRRIVFYSQVQHIKALKIRQKQTFWLRMGLKIDLVFTNCVAKWKPILSDVHDPLWPCLKTAIKKVKNFKNSYYFILKKYNHLERWQFSFMHGINKCAVFFVFRLYLNHKRWGWRQKKANPTQFKVLVSV